MNKLEFALHVLYLAVDTYSCDACDYKNACYKVCSDGCLLKEAFDTVHQEILRKEKPTDAED